MNNKVLSWIGIVGVSFFVIASVVGGFQLTDYDPISQYISETMAIGTPYGEELRYFGYIPSGMLLTIFSFGIISKFPKSTLTKIGFWGIGIFYGLATILAAIFPCDTGCNKEFIDPSISQLLHNLTGLLTYIFVPISILLISIGLRESQKHLGLSKIGAISSLVSVVFVGLLFVNPESGFVGLHQRIIESSFAIWILACAIHIRKISILD